MSKQIMTASGPLAAHPELANLLQRQAGDSLIATAQGNNGFWYVRIEDLEDVSERLCAERFQEVKRFATFIVYNEQGRAARSHWNKRLGAGNEQHAHFSSQQRGFEGTWAIYDLAQTFATHIDEDFGQHIHAVYRQITTGIYHADEQPTSIVPAEDMNLDHIEQIGTAIAALARQSRAHGKELALVARQIEDVGTVANRGLALAAQALMENGYITIERYVRERNLQRQLHPGRPQEQYGIWLTGYCIEHGIHVEPREVLGRPYARMNAYPISAIDSTFEGYLKNMSGQGRLNL